MHRRHVAVAQAQRVQREDHRCVKRVLLDDDRPDPRDLLCVEPVLQPDGTFFAQDALEDLAAIVKREHLDVERSVGFHVGETRWTDVEAELQRTGRSPRA